LKTLDHLYEEFLDEDAARDFVTHVFGTYSSCIEFLGFKTTSGKLYYTGDPKKGTPFLYGKFHQKFHYLKLGIIDGGINYIKPFFVPSVFFNFNLNLDFDLYRYEKLEFNTLDHFEDEKLLKNIKDEQEYLSHILVPIDGRDVDFIFDEDDCYDVKLRETYSYLNLFSIKNGDKQNSFSRYGKMQKVIEEESYYDDEEDNDYKYIYDEIITTEGGFGPDNKFDDDSDERDENEFLEDEDEDEDRIQNHMDKERQEIEMLEYELEMVSKSNQFNPSKYLYFNGWNGVTVKKLDVSTLFLDPFSLEKFANRYFNEIQYEIDDRINIYNEYNDPVNFYSKYFVKDNCYYHNYFPECLEEDYRIQLIDIESQFEEIANSFFVAKNNNETDIYNNKKKAIDSSKTISTKYFDAKTLARKWHSIASYFKRKILVSGIRIAIGVETAKKVLVNCEDNYVDKKYSLFDKIKVLKILSEIKPKKKSDNSTTLENIDYYKKAFDRKIKNIIENKKEEKKKQDQIKREQEQIKREQELKKQEEIKKEAERKKTDEAMKKAEEAKKKAEEAKKKSAEEKIKEEERKKIESNLKEDQNKKEQIRKNQEEAKNQEKDKKKLPDNLPKFEKVVTLNDIHSITKDMDRIKTLITDGKIKNLEEKKSLNLKYEELKKKKTELAKFLVEKKNTEISEKLKVDVEDLKKKEIEKINSIIKEEKEKAIAEKKAIETNKIKELSKPITFGEFDIPETTEIHREQEMVQGKEFTDPLFPANIQSLCPYDEKLKCWKLPPEIEEGDLQNWEKFSWSKIDDIFRTPNYQIFVNNIEPDDIIQGSLGDCYFLSAIAALCKFPDLIKKLFLFKEKSLDRCYGIYLRKNGIWKLVLVDDYIPCYGGLRKKFAFSSANENEMWVVLLEKAWAKICGSYAKVIAGQSSEVFDAITNAPTECIWVPQISKEEVWKKLQEAKNNEFIMTAGTGNRISAEEYQRVNLEPGHAYTIIDVYELKVNGVNTKLLKIRNPWGVGEWSGNWSDQSNLWTPALKKQVGLEEKDDGVFFMTFEDFIKYYIVINICRIHKNYHYSFVKFHKVEVSKPNVLSLEVKEQSKVYLQQHQKNPRYLLRNGRNAEPILIHMLVVDENFNFIGAACDDSSSIFLNLDLKPGLYYVYIDINHRYVNSQQIHGYNVTTYSSSIVNLFNDDSINPIDVCRKGIISYAKSKLKPQKRDLIQYYSASNIIPQFPYIFSVVENLGTGPSEVTYELLNNFESSFFPDEHKGSKKLTKRIESKQTEVFYIVRHKLDSAVEYNWSTRKI